MFKRLRERIADEAIRFPIGQLNNNSNKDGEGKSAEGTEDLITLSDSSSVVVPHTSSQFSIGDEDGAASEQNTPKKKSSDTANGSANDHTPLSRSNNQAPTADYGYAKEYRPTKSNYIPQSDIESEREDPPTLNLEGISKNQLLAIIDLLKAKAYKYKNKYSEVVKNYKELRDEKLKIETTLIDHQDKALRRMAELREQCQLEQKAKAHLESNLRLLMEEKDSRISVLETQINLLKESEKLGSSKSLHDACDSQNSDSSGGDLQFDNSSCSVPNHSLLQEKLERLDHQVNQAKKTITSQTDQLSLLRKQNENLSTELETKVKKLNQLEDEDKQQKSHHETVLSEMQLRLKELQKQQEESNMSMAETKKNMHEELEFKEKQLVKAKEEVKQLQSSYDSEKLKLIELQKQHEEKVAELKRQLESTEKMLEEEKENLMQELGRGKSAALSLMQQECTRKITAIEEEWKIKLQELQNEKDNKEQLQGDIIDKKLTEMEEKLKASKEFSEKLKSSISQLKKENSILKSSLEKSEKDLSVIQEKYEALQTEYNNLQELNKKQSFHFEEKLKQDLKDRLLVYEQEEVEHHTLREFLKEQLNEKQNVIDDMVHNKNALYNQIDEHEKRENQLKSTIEEFETREKELQHTADQYINKVKELQSKINELESAQHNKNNVYVNELNDSNSKFQELKKSFEAIFQSDKLKCQEIKRLQGELKQFDLVKETLTKGFEEEIILLKNNNEAQSSRINVLSESYKNLELKLLAKEEEIGILNENLSKSSSEISDLMSCLEEKLASLETLKLKCLQVEEKFGLLEKNSNLNSAFFKQDLLCKEVQEKVSVLLDQFVSLKEKSTVRVNVGTNTDSITENIITAEKELPHDFESEEDRVIFADNKLSSSKCNERLHLKQLQNEVCDLKSKNKKLKEELTKLKDFTENQSVEFAKNITELHESLNQLQEERNNLSLVLQSIETQNHEVDPNSLEIRTKESEIKFELNLSNENASKIDILELNKKVKAEIAALSTQTEMVNNELKCLREQFSCSQLAYSEKLAQLNSKLMLRTELLLNIKNELDDSASCFEELRDLVETLKKQLDEKEVCLKMSQNEKFGLENRYKAIKEKYHKKELSLKELHITQLNDLKKQTEATIEKLNQDILMANASTKDNEDLNLKLENIKENYEKEILDLRNPEHVLKCRKVIDSILEICKSYDSGFVKNFKKWDFFNTKISNLNSNINVVSRKLIENKKLSEAQQSKITDLQNQIDVLVQDNKASLDLKTNYEEITKALEKAKSELKSEKELKKCFENDLLVLKEIQMVTLKTAEEAKEENYKLNILLRESSFELEEVKNKHKEVCLSLNDASENLKKFESQQRDFHKLKTTHDSLCEKLHTMKEFIAKEKKTVAESLNSISQWETAYNSMVPNLNSFASNSFERLEKVNLNLDNCELKFTSLESQFLGVAKVVKFQRNYISQLKCEIEKLKCSNESFLEEMKKTSSDTIELSKFKTLEVNLNEYEVQLKELRTVLKETERKNELFMTKISSLESQLMEKCELLKEQENKINIENCKLLKCEESYTNLHEEHQKADVHLKEISDLYHKNKKELEILCEKIKEQDIKLNSMISEEEINEYKKLSSDKINQLTAEVQNLTNIVETLKAEVFKKGSEVNDLQIQKKHLEAVSNESTKSLLEKLESAENNYATQVEETKNQIRQLEVSRGALEDVQNELSVLKSLEKTLKSEVMSKEENLNQQKDKFETIIKEQATKIISLQEMMKDKENMILKLNSNTELLTKELSEKNEELKSKIKVLEEEREQLMIQAQERVSKTEAKCREDVKTLQDKNNQLLKEIDGLNARVIELERQLSESRQFAESSAAAVRNEISELKEELEKAASKLTEAEALKQYTEQELSAKLHELQGENSMLLGKTNHIEKLKSEKEELNEKVKKAEQQITSVKQLEYERDALREQNAAILKELELLKQSDPELQGKFESLKENEKKLLVEIEEFKKSKENLETESSKLKSSFENEVRTLKSENEQLSKQLSLLEKLQFGDPESDSVKDYISVIRGECETAMKAKEEELENKLKHLVRDFCIQMDVKDKDCDKMVSEVLEKNQDLEDRLLREHRKESSELRQALFEKECALDEVREHYEDTLQKKEKKIKELQTALRKLTESSPKNINSSDMDLITEEGSDWDDSWAVPDECIENTSPESSKEHLQQIELLQEELTKCNAEIKELKTLLRLSPPESTASNNTKKNSGQPLPEPTEIEYLKNIIFEYMMGKEPITLAKVIAAVLRFSDSQTQQVIRREEARHPTK